MHRFYKLLFVMVSILSFNSLPLYSDPSGCCSSKDNSCCFDKSIGGLKAISSFWKSCFCNNSTFYLGAVGYGSRLKTDKTGIGVDSYYGSGDSSHSVNGSQWGIVTGITMRNCCCLYFNSEFEWATGHLSSCDQCIDSLPDQRLDQYLWSSRVGYNFFCQSMIYTPYAGIGYRYADHDLNSSHSSLNYREWYGIIGGRIDRSFCEIWCIGAKGEVYFPFSSSVKLKDYCGRITTDCKIGYQIELPITRSFCFCGKAFTLTLSPFYREFVNGESKENTFDVETIRVPELKVQNYGAKLFLNYCF